MHLIHGSRHMHIRREMFLASAIPPQFLAGPDPIIWRKCRLCGYDSPPVQLDKAKALSFSKLLDLFFAADSVYYGRSNKNDDSECQHALFRDHILYFAYKTHLVTMCCEPFELYTLLLPKYHMSSPDLDADLASERRMLGAHGEKVYCCILPVAQIDSP